MNTNIMNMTALRMWRRSSPASVLNPRAQMSNANDNLVKPTPLFFLWMALAEIWTSSHF